MSDARLHYEVHDGDGPYILLVHGILSSRAQWLPNLAALSSIARPVVVELFGHGRSPSPEEPEAYAPAHYVREFERIREELGAERWSVLGQSLGAALTLRYVLDHPERVIAHVFTNSNSAFADDEWVARVRPGLEAQAQRLATDGKRVFDEHPLNPARSKRLSPALRAAFETDVALLDPGGVARTGLYTVPPSPVRERIGGNRVPSLLVFGEREARFSDHARFAEAHMPLLQVVRVDGGHAVNIDAAQAFNESVVAFLRGVLADEGDA